MTLHSPQKTAALIHKALKPFATKKRKDLCQSFFQTHTGGYGEGDVFLGVTVPDLRTVLKKFRADFSFELVQELLNSIYHEERYAAMIILIHLYKKTKDTKVKKSIFDMYIQNTGFKKGINNWDLIDISSYNIVGDYMYTHMDQNERRKATDKMIKHKDVWIRRMMVVATFFQIRNHENTDILHTAEKLLQDKHDLIHKAVGWMLRESGKRCSELDLISFLRKHKDAMPRVMYGYAKERLRLLF